MIDFNKKYLDIGSKYFTKEELEDNSNKVMKSIKITLKRAFLNCRNLAIWGGGQHTDNLFKNYSVDLKDIKYIVDNNIEAIENKFKGYKILKPENILISGIDGIIISSFDSRKEIAKNIKNIDKNIKIFDIYSDLEEKENIYLNLPFYMMSDLYLEIHKKRKYINSEIDTNNKLKAIEDLISIYYKIHDFINVFKYIDIYNALNRNMKFNNLKIDLNYLLKELRECIKNKKNNIALFFIDSLRFKDLQNMKYLNNVANNNINFTNAFSTGITTYESMISAFNGYFPLEKENYKRQFVKDKECKFIMKAIKKKCSINIYSLGCDKFIDSNCISYGEGGTYCSTTLWNYITDLVNSDNNISMLYFLQESHSPHMGGIHNVDIKTHTTPFTTNEGLKQLKTNYVEQYKESLLYLDEQLNFYCNMLDDDNKLVYFSDHGQIIDEAMNDIKDLDTLLGWHDDRYKTIFIIKGNKNKKQQIKKMFSLIDFNNLICGLMDDKLNIKYRKFVEMNFSPVHNKVIRNRYKMAKKEEYLDGFRVFRNKKYKVAVTGKEKIRVFKIVDGNDVEVLNKKECSKIIKSFDVELKLYPLC